MKYETKMDLIEYGRAYLGVALLICVYIYKPWGFTL
jgi:hypothetical protein